MIYAIYYKRCLVPSVGIFRISCAVYLVGLSSLLLGKCLFFLVFYPVRAKFRPSEEAVLGNTQIIIRVSPIMFPEEACASN